MRADYVALYTVVLLPTNDQIKSKTILVLFFNNVNIDDYVNWMCLGN